MFITITRKNFKTDIKKIFENLEILKRELNEKNGVYGNNKENGFYGNIGSTPICFEDSKQLTEIINNYRLPWYKISVECNILILEKKYIPRYNSTEKKKFLDGFADQCLLFFCGIPLAFVFIIYDTCFFIYKKVIYIFY
jgi:hypothetical protein